MVLKSCSYGTPDDQFAGLNQSPTLPGLPCHSLESWAIADGTGKQMPASAATASAMRSSSLRVRFERMPMCPYRREKPVGCQLPAARPFRSYFKGRPAVEFVTPGQKVL